LGYISTPGRPHLIRWLPACVSTLDGHCADGGLLPSRNDCFGFAAWFPHSRLGFASQLGFYIQLGAKPWLIDSRSRTADIVGRRSRILPFAEPSFNLDGFLSRLNAPFRSCCFRPALRQNAQGFRLGTALEHCFECSLLGRIEPGN